MSQKSLVYYDTNTSVENLIEQAHKNEVTLSSSEVSIEHAAHASFGEVWSPQLPAYQEWVASQQLEGQGHEGDLLVVGSLGMGISDEARQRIIAPAVLGQKGEAEEAAGALAPHTSLELSEALTVRQDESGYALVKVDLRLFAQQVGQRSDLVVVLPAYIDSIPVVRITAEAFSRRFVQGVGVRLMVVPSSVERIDSAAFSVLSVNHIHIGSGVQMLGEQPCEMAGVSPRLAKRAYSVSSRNKHYSSCEGSLLSEGGTQLLFLPSPYPRVVELPSGLTRVGSAAFASGCEPPAVVYAPDTLTYLASKVWDEAVWFCPAQAPVVSQLVRRGVRLAHTRIVEQEGCWYDVGDDEAELVAGPPPPETPSKRFAAEAALRAAAARGQHDQNKSSCAAAHAGQPDLPSPALDSLVLPREIEGRPLTRIGVRALSNAPETLIIPGTVVEVLRDNAARGVKHLSLPQGLKRIGAHSFCSRILEDVVSIPRSVTSIGLGCFEYAFCRFEQVGVRAHISADQLQSCFVEENSPRRVACSGEPGEAVARDSKASLGQEAAVPFDFACYDALLCSGKNLPDKMGAVLYRLASPYLLKHEHGVSLVSYLRDHEREALERVAFEGDRFMVEALVMAGFIDDGTFDRQIELLRAKNRTDCVIYLMEQRRLQAEPTPAKNRFAL